MPAKSTPLYPNLIQAAPFALFVVVRINIMKQYPTIQPTVLVSRSSTSQIPVFVMNCVVSTPSDKRNPAMVTNHKWRNFFVIRGSNIPAGINIAIFNVRFNQLDNENAFHASRNARNKCILGCTSITSRCIVTHNTIVM